MVNMELNQPCVGTDGDDVIITYDGDDIIIAGKGDDKVIAGAGNDIVCGGDGDDTLLGNEGDDILDGGEGSNVLSGDVGNDTCIRPSVASNCEKVSKTSLTPVDDCKEILGKWHWFDNGMVLFTEDHKVQWHEPMTGRKGHSAEWKCDAKSGVTTIPWTNGFTDKMKVIASGRSLQGKNNRGMTIWAQRISGN